MMDLERWFGAPIIGSSRFDNGQRTLVFGGRLPPRMPPGPCDCRRAHQVRDGGPAWVLSLCELHREDPTYNSGSGE